MGKPAQQLDCTNPSLRRSRGRPREFDRDAALGKAMRLFWQKGYDATSISELTEVMGIKTPSLYASFGCKESLYKEALQYYRANYEHLSFGGFFAAKTARAAVYAFLSDTIIGLTSGLLDNPYGCMVTLSSVGSAGHEELASEMRLARTATLDKLTMRLSRAVTDGEFGENVDTHALARFIQGVQAGLSILARDGASRAELQAVVELAMLGWDARTGAGNTNAVA